MNKLRSAIFTAFLIILAAGAGPAFSAVWQWSKTADNNANADPAINWAEGMSPSSVNDSARAMMAQIANWRDDISGLLATGGTSTAYTITSNSGYCSASSTPADGQALAFTVNSTNGASPTLAVDSCTAAPIQSAAGVAVPSATLISGSPYKVKYSVANSAWMLLGFYSSATNVPLGGVMPYTLMTVPNSNFIFPAGQCISTITYATYWNALGSPGPGSCGANQFAVIDLSGSVPAGLDTMPGFSAANRLTSASTGCGTAMTTVGARCANGSQSHTLSSSEQASMSVSGSASVSGTGPRVLQFNGGLPTTVAAPGTPAAVAYISALDSTFSLSSSGSISGTASGGGGAHPVVQPTVGVTYLLRVL